MNNRCKECGKCCLDTEMPLSIQDIKKILKKYPIKLKRELFALKNSENFYQLKNIDGHCFFFEERNKICKIYEFRPYGCTIYPIIYDYEKKKCVYDDFCPRSKLFYQEKNKFKLTCNTLKHFLKDQLEII